MDISIDGYDVGGWALRGGEEMSIERSAYEAKKFTFYRVKTAPKEAGIVSGQPEMVFLSVCLHLKLSNYSCKLYLFVHQMKQRVQWKEVCKINEIFFIS